MGSPIYNEAMKRALIIAALTGVSSVAGLITQTTDWRVIVAAVVPTIIGIVLTRGLGEGTFDAHRADTGRVIPSDVPMASAKLDVTKRA